MGNANDEDAVLTQMLVERLQFHGLGLALQTVRLEQVHDQHLRLRRHGTLSDDNAALLSFKREGGSVDGLQRQRRHFAADLEFASRKSARSQEGRSNKQG